MSTKMGTEHRRNVNFSKTSNGSSWDWHLPNASVSTVGETGTLPRISTANSCGMVQASNQNANCESWSCNNLSSHRKSRFQATYLGLLTFSKQQNSNIETSFSVTFGTSPIPALDEPSPPASSIRRIAQEVRILSTGSLQSTCRENNIS